MEKINTLWVTICKGKDEKETIGAVTLNDGTMLQAVSKEKKVSEMAVENLKRNTPSDIEIKLVSFTRDS